MLQYHNVTPAHYFAPFDAGLFRLASLARQELATLVGHVDLALGVSELQPQRARGDGIRAHRRAAAGGRPVTRHPANAAPGAREDPRHDDMINFLFVGRIAPNKKIEDHIWLAEHYKRYVDAYYRFIFVGKYDAVPRYYQSIRGMMTEYRLLAERFVFTGPVPDEDLAVYYRHAAVYISLSEHEGFCAPLLEAMATDVPILAYSSAAVPETLGGAGVQFAPKDMEYAAELLGMLTFDDDLRARVIAGQRKRLADFGDARIAPALSTLVAYSGGELPVMKLPLSSNAMAPRSSADRNSSAVSLRSGSPRSTRSTS
ncbi:MAG: glycosyltransferase [Vicinamibacterales bacterium]